MALANRCADPNCDAKIALQSVFCRQHCKSSTYRQCSEYLAALYLFNEHNIISVPSPNGVYDLLTIAKISMEGQIKQMENLRIEVKRELHLTQRQIQKNSLDFFMILWNGEWVFIPYEAVIRAANNTKNNKKIPQYCVAEWAQNKDNPCILK